MLVDLCVKRGKLAQRIEIRGNRVARLVCFPQERGEVFDVHHSSLLYNYCYDNKSTKQVVYISRRGAENVESAELFNLFNNPFLFCDGRKWD